MCRCGGVAECDVSWVDESPRTGKSKKFGSFLYSSAYGGGAFLGLTWVSGGPPREESRVSGAPIESAGGSNGASPGELLLQDQVGSGERAERFYRTQVVNELNNLMMEFISRMDMFFLR
jgi:hypothetical protein